MVGRIDIYTDWKRATVAEINACLLPFANQLLKELFELSQPWPVQEIATAVQTLAPSPAQGPTVDVPQTLLTDVSGILTEFESNIGLRLESGGVSVWFVDGLECWGIAAGFSCKPLQAELEKALGHPVCLKIVIRYNEAREEVEAELADACFLELADLHVFKAVSTEYWTGHKTWLSLRSAF